MVVPNPPFQFPFVFRVFCALGIPPQCQSPYIALGHDAVQILSVDNAVSFPFLDELLLMMMMTSTVGFLEGFEGVCIRNLLRHRALSRRP